MKQKKFKFQLLHEFFFGLQMQSTHIITYPITADSSNRFLLSRNLNTRFRRKTLRTKIINLTLFVTAAVIMEYFRKDVRKGICLYIMHYVVAPLRTGHAKSLANNANCVETRVFRRRLLNTVPCFIALERVAELILGGLRI